MGGSTFQVEKRQMANKLSQPGCDANIGSKGGRAVVPIDIPEVENSYARRKQPRSGSAPVNASIPVTKNLIRKQPSTNGKEIAGLGGGPSKPPRMYFSTPEGVDFILEKFQKYCDESASSGEQPGEKPGETAYKRITREYPHLLEDKLHERIGNVPGVPVGKVFRVRMQLMLVGLHGTLLTGIFSKYVDGERLALSVVSSGGYEDDKDDGDTLYYTGEGGCDWRRSKTQCSDQTLEGGNKALRNSCRMQNPVRVIRGTPDNTSRGSKVYSYDGLYKVKDWWEDEGVSGFKVYIFKLVREPGQAPLRFG